MQLVAMLKPEFTQDGNMYCFAYPSSKGLPNNCILGFGETPLEAAQDFNNNFYNSKAVNKKDIKVEIPEYVECTTYSLDSGTFGKIYPVKNGKVQVNDNWYYYHVDQFKPSTKEQYEKQQLFDKVN